MVDVLALGLSLWKKAAQYAQENNLNALTGKLNFRMGTATWQPPKCPCLLDFAQHSNFERERSMWVIKLLLKVRA